MQKEYQKEYNTWDSNVVPHPSTNQARTCLTSLNRREAVLSCWYGRIQPTPWILYILHYEKALTRTSTLPAALPLLRTGGSCFYCLLVGPIFSSTWYLVSAPFLSKMIIWRPNGLSKLTL